MSDDDDGRDDHHEVKDEKKKRKEKKKHKKEKKKHKKEKKKRHREEEEAVVVVEEDHVDEPVMTAEPPVEQNDHNRVDGEQQAVKRKYKKAAVERMPEWMRNGLAMTVDGPAPSFGDLGVSARMVNLLREEMGVTAAFPVQAAVIPHVLRDTLYVGGDVLVMSATGSGKTLAFAVPIVEILEQSRVKRVACLAVLPTKDLAAQVHEVFSLLCVGTHLTVALFAGEKPFHEEVEQLQSVPEIIVATPGRLRDHISSPLLRSALASLRWLVIDESDRLLSKQYHQWVSDVMPLLQDPAETVEGPFADPPLQKLLFSATMTSNPRKLALLRLYKPTFFHARTDVKEALQGLPVLPACLKECPVKVRREEDRPLILVWLLRQSQLEGKAVLIFVSTIERATRLHAILTSMLRDQALGLYTSSILSREREAVLGKFRAGQLSALVVTDVLARGLDIANIGAVVNYDCPFHEQTYVHRVGRTARANQEGSAYTLGLPAELARWRKMRELLRGGNVAEQALKADAAFVNSVRPRYEEVLERMLKRVRGWAGPEQRLQLQEERARLSIPILNEENAQIALEVLRKNQSISQ